MFLPFLSLLDRGVDVESEEDGEESYSSDPGENSDSGENMVEGQVRMADHFTISKSTLSLQTLIMTQHFLSDCVYDQMIIHSK